MGNSDVLAYKKGDRIDPLRSSLPVLRKEETTATKTRKRFAIVKTETIEPFKRGRWIYMDFCVYMTKDAIHITSEQSDAMTDENVNKTNELVIHKKIEQALDLPKILFDGSCS